MLKSKRSKRERRNKPKSSGNILIDSQLKLQTITPMTDTQRDVFEAYEEKYNLMLHGEAGTGKTFVALYLAFRSLEAREHQRVIIIRSAVTGRDLGYMKGSLEEKSAVYEQPYKEICTSLFGRGDAYEILKRKNAVEFTTTSYLRGITFDNAVVFVDEVQNMSESELHTIITRIGENTRIIYAGDTRQDDLTSERKKEYSGLRDFLRIIDIMEEFDTIDFTIDDVVRSGLVKSYLKARNKIGL